METIPSSNPSEPNSLLFSFKVDDVNLSNKVPSLVTAEEAILKVIEGKIQDSSHKNNTEATFLPSGLPGFTLAIHAAYQCHLNLKLSVSDFILVIGQGLSQHINNNVEKLRDYFVNHVGKEQLRVIRDEFVVGSENDWSTVFGEFVEEVKKKVKSDIYDVVIDDTSVATPTSRIVSEINLLDCMKGYFGYQVSTLCGIPEITLEGSTDDWEKLRQKVKKLSNMNKDNCLDLDWWLKALVPVIDTICDSAIHKKVDKTFWSRIYKYENSSGGPYIDGWVTVFFPYLKRGRNAFDYPISTIYLPKQICEIPFYWMYHGEEIHMKFHGGFLGARFDKSKWQVAPEPFWCVTYQKFGF